MTTTSGDPQATPKLSDSKLKIDFIDPLFAVAIHIGVTDGLMNEVWLRDRTYPHVNDIPNLLVFVSGLWLLVLSWVGYHKSIESKPIKGDMRFALDIVLLIGYMALLLYYSNIGIFSIIIFAVFCIYVVWDYFKIVEWNDEKRYYAGPAPDLFWYLIGCVREWIVQNKKATVVSEVVTIGWLLYFLVLLPFSLNQWAETYWGKIVFACLVIFGLQAYRYDKQATNKIIFSWWYKAALIVALVGQIVWACPKIQAICNWGLLKG